MYQVKGKIKIDNRQAVLKAIQEQGGAIVLQHALAMGSVAYQIYPVGPDHKDGTPHTRDTFAILNGTKIVAEKGQFNHAQNSYVMSDAPDPSGKRGLSFIAKGASFYVERGTIYMEARPILRMLIKRARQDITNSLRKINLILKGKS